jgi:hypothetical protein
MGIRLHCPNGHKLNVKSFLAGKRGICPECGARFDIPGNADVEEDAPAVVPGAVPVALNPAVAGGTSLPAGGMPANGPAASHLYAPAPLQASAAPLGGAIPAGGLPATVMPAAAPAPTAYGAASDPIAEAPNAVWYVRPPSGGQFGPAGGDVMRRWITEGRVGVDSLVWREGWADWRPAGPLFHGVFGGAGPAPAAAAGGEAGAVPDVGRRTAANVYRARRRGPSSLAVVIIVILVLASLALFGVLIVVVQFTSTPRKASLNDGPAAAAAVSAEHASAACLGVPPVPAVTAV